MSDEQPNTFQYLTRTYRTVKIVALTVLSIVGLLISLAALNVQISPKWVAVQIPLYAVAIAGIAVIGGCAFGMAWALVLLRSALGTASYYRNKAIRTENLFADLKDLAYTDPITGAPNSNSLRQELSRNRSGERCLILLDLRNFGEINKKFNHWKGDEYLREFAQMVTMSSRRNEYFYKRRPFTYEDAKPEVADTDEVKAFRKNSGGDEFYILLEGSIAEGLGYLNRLQRRAEEFEDMARGVLHSDHAFAFQAGLVAVAPDETFESAARRVSECLGLAMAEDNPLLLYWIEAELPHMTAGSIDAKNVEAARRQFVRPE